MKRLLIILIVAALVGVVFAPASTVMAVASGTRSLPSSVPAGGSCNVTISTADYGAFGQVVETLPEGFSYVTGSCTLSEAAVTDMGQVVKFTLLGEEDTAFTYTVTASSTLGTHTFSGKLKDEDKGEYDVGGQAQIIVPATRSLPSSVTAGANFNVSISTFDYGVFGQVVETLPAGFSYVTGSCNLSAAAVTDMGQVVKFTLLGDTAFTYTVKASSTTGTFSGILKDEDKAEYDIGEDQITVTAPAPAPSGAVGGGVGGAPTYYTETNLFGTEERFRIDSDGEILKAIEATSADGMLTVTIEKGTIALDEDGDRLESLEAAVDLTPPPPPEDAYLIDAYDFGPDGATFEPPITLTWNYDPEALPEDVDLVIAYYDEAAEEWVYLPVERVNNTLTALVSNFTTFAIIARAVPPPPPPVVAPPPPPPPEVVPAPPPPPEVVPPPAPPEEEEVVPEVPVKPIPWPLIGGIIAAVVVVILLVYFLWWRRRAY